MFLIELQKCYITKRICLLYNIMYLVFIKMNTIVLFMVLLKYQKHIFFSVGIITYT